MYIVFLLKTINYFHLKTKVKRTLDLFVNLDSFSQKIKQSINDRSDHDLSFNF